MALVKNAFSKIVVPKNKLVNYLLSETHLTGRYKAKFFRQFGFDINSASLLEQSLINLVEPAKIITTIETPYGKKHQIDGPLKAPSGRSPKIRSIWMEKEKGILIFVTTYPLKQEK